MSGSRWSGGLKRKTDAAGSIPGRIPWTAWALITADWAAAGTSFPRRHTNSQKGGGDMTERQKRFCAEYLVDLNATQAAIRAGYSPESAANIGCENLRKPNIRACIDKSIAEQAKRTSINADRVLRELGRIAFVNAADVINMNDATVIEGADRDDTAAIASVKVKVISGANGDGIEREIRLADKLKALELIGRHLGMFTDKVDLTGAATVQIIDNIPGEDENA